MLDCCSCLELCTTAMDESCKRSEAADCNIKLDSVFETSTFDICVAWLDDNFEDFNFSTDLTFKLVSWIEADTMVRPAVAKVCALVLSSTPERSTVFVTVGLLSKETSVDLPPRTELESFKVNSGCDIKTYCGVVSLAKISVSVSFDTRTVSLEVISSSALLLFVMSTNPLPLE